MREQVSGRNYNSVEQCRENLLRMTFSQYRTQNALEAKKRDAHSVDSPTPCKIQIKSIWLVHLMISYSYLKRTLRVERKKKKKSFIYNLPKTHRVPSFTFRHANYNVCLIINTTPTQKVQTCARGGIINQKYRVKLKWQMTLVIYIASLIAP